MEDQITGKLLPQLNEVQIKWDIANFTSFFEKGEYFLRSSEFQVMDSVWYLGVQNQSDASKGSKSEDWIYVYLGRADSGTSIMVYCTLEIYQRSETKHQTKQSFYQVYPTDGYKEWGFKVLANSLFLECKSALLHSGTLTIRCCAKFIDWQLRVMKLTQLDTLSEDLGRLFVSNANSDVTFRLQGKEYQAHRSILAARSEVVASMFKHELSESKTGVVDILDCDPDAFGVFLRYLYTGEVEDLNQENVQHLYKIADKYGDKKLKYSCVTSMRKQISVESVTTIAILAQLYEEKGLLDFAKAFFNENVDAVLSSKSWEELLSEDNSLANRLLKDILSTSTHL